MLADFKSLASPESLEKTFSALAAKGYEVTVVENGTEALEKIKALVPARASVMNGASVTLEQIGKGESPYNKRKVTFILVKEDLGF